MASNNTSGYKASIEASIKKVCHSDKNQRDVSSRRETDLQNKNVTDSSKTLQWCPQTGVAFNGKDQEEELGEVEGEEEDEYDEDGNKKVRRSKRMRKPTNKSNLGGGQEFGKVVRKPLVNVGGTGGSKTGKSVDSLTATTLPSSDFTGQTDKRHNDRNAVTSKADKNLVSVGASSRQRSAIDDDAMSQTSGDWVAHDVTQRDEGDRRRQKQKEAIDESRRLLEEAEKRLADKISKTPSLAPPSLNFGSETRGQKVLDRSAKVDVPTLIGQLERREREQLEEMETSDAVEMEEEADEDEDEEDRVEQALELRIQDLEKQRDIDWNKKVAREKADLAQA
jgi:hypothetical protein